MDSVSSADSARLAGAARIRQNLRKRPLLGFFLLAFAGSWAYALIAFGLLEIQTDGEIALVLGLLGFALAGPTMAAVTMAAALEGRPGIGYLAGRFALWRSGLRWYAFVLLAAPALLVAGHLMLPGGVAAFERAPGLEAIAAYLSALALLFGIAAAEEAGWRGFALPRLQRRYGPVAGTLTLGILWGLWHLPLFALIAGYNGAGSSIAEASASFLALVVVLTGIAFILTWVFNSVGRSLLMTTLLHASLNSASSTMPSLFPGIDPAGLTILLPIVLVLIAAAAVLVATRGQLGFTRPSRLIEPLDAPAAASSSGELAPARLRRSMTIAGAAVLAAALSVSTLATWDPTASRGSFVIDGQALYLECVGEGSPTIVMEAGNGGDHRSWDQVVPSVRNGNRTCTYDRPNTGRSANAAGVRTESDVVDALHELLAAAMIAPPYVLVGHSVGGISMRLFASRYPDDVVGVVLVDATPTTFLDDACAIVDAARCQAFREDIQPGRNDGVEYGGATASILAAGPFPTVPLIVLAADDHHVDSFPAVMAIEFEAMWLRRQEELAATVPGSVLLRVASGHNVQDLQPQAVIDAITQVLDHVR